MRSVRVASVGGKFQQKVTTGPHEVVADEPVELGGEDKGLAPFEYVFAGLGACTSMTIKMYADRKGWPVTAVVVDVSGDKRKEDGAFALRREIRLVGDLSEEQRTRLLEIANKCPVHKMLTGTIVVESVLV